MLYELQHRVRSTLILLIEGEFCLAEDATETLNAAGAEVLGPFPRERDGLAALVRRTPDCAILDINTGGGASFILADALQARGVPFMFFTGYDRAAIPERFADTPRLEKPVDDRRLVSAAQSLCCAARSCGAVT